ncbi:MAG: DegT/DnrJ/EryC1/StrS family aminotransferase [Chitinophagaceae bacterium]
MIEVVRPFLPPIAEYQRYVEEIWSRNWLTNDGPLVKELEVKLREFLHVPHLYFVTNGTIALQLAIQALGLKGEIITTPFSYVATTSSIVWEHCTPVFVDIEPGSLNLDPDGIEEAISEKTTAILATHVYGLPCEVKKIGTLAKKYGLRVIYDGAHAFGSKISNVSLLDFGDISTCSFHATKLFHTIEGGCVITRDPLIGKKIEYLRNFGHDGPHKYHGVGINGKNSEFHAAMGLCVLKYVEQILANRRNLSLYYESKLANFPLTRPLVSEGTDYNYAYFPVIFPTESLLLKAIRQLEEIKVSPRRYFYPTLESLDYILREYKLPVAQDISRRVLCLPLYHDLKLEEIDLIVKALM